MLYFAKMGHRMSSVAYNVIQHHMRQLELEGESQHGHKAPAKNSSCSASSADNRFSGSRWHIPDTTSLARATSVALSAKPAAIGIVDPAAASRSRNTQFFKFALLTWRELNQANSNQPTKSRCGRVFLQLQPRRLSASHRQTLGQLDGIDHDGIVDVEACA